MLNLGTFVACVKSDEPWCDEEMEKESWTWDL